MLRRTPIYYPSETLFPHAPHRGSPCGLALGPDPVWLGTRPTQATNSRPERKVFASPIAATAAVAVNKPTPGIWAIAWTAGSSRIHCPRRRSIRSEEHTSELQSLMRISYAVFCLKKKKQNKNKANNT